MNKMPTTSNYWMQNEKPSSAKTNKKYFSQK